jgi:hypothetical protein
MTDNIVRIDRVPSNDPWYVRTELDVAWMDIYNAFPENAFDYTRWAVVPAAFANAGQYVEVPF